MMIPIILVATFSSLAFAGTNGLNFQCTSRGERCKLPFVYEGKEYYQCAETESLLWCPTQILPSGKYDISYQCTFCKAPSICYMQADEFPSLSWKVDCPPSCANISTRLWTSAKFRPKTGGRYYSVDSFVCAAAIRERTISAVFGGTVSVRKLGDKLHEVIDSNGKQGDQKKAPLFAVQGVDEDYDVPLLLFSDRNKIWVAVDGKAPEVLLKGQTNAVAMAANAVRSVLYWTDVAEKKIYRANLTATSNRVQVLSSLTVKVPDGIAFDWIHNLLFWTDAELHKVSVSDEMGKHPTTLISRTESYFPRAIAVDPKRGYMYVSDWGTEAKIEKCYVTVEATCQTIVGRGVTWPNGLALDVERNLIYWADAQSNSISVATTEGEFRRELISSTAIVRHPYALLLHEDRLYWTDWKLGVQSIDKTNGQDFRLHVMDQAILAGLAMYDANHQLKYRNRCQHSDCKYLCLVGPLGPRCSCPDGYMPSAKDPTDCVASTSDFDKMFSDLLTSIDHTFDTMGNLKRKKGRRKGRESYEDL